MSLLRRQILIKIIAFPLIAQSCLVRAESLQQKSKTWRSVHELRKFLVACILFTWLDLLKGAAYTQQELWPQVMSAW